MFTKDQIPEKNVSKDLSMDSILKNIFILIGFDPKSEGGAKF